MSAIETSISPTRLREPLEQARSAMAHALAQGATGRQACASLSRAYDHLISQLWEAALAEEASDQPDLALVATGGWGREEVCPYSDIDFILLVPDADSQVARRVADRLLYPLWDAGIRVGHAVRTPSAAARLASGDLSTATALLDVRHVTGSAELTAALGRATRRVIAPGGNANGFVDRLAGERSRRRDKFGDSLYLLEPNLKHGIGALRDVATALWAAKARWSVATASELVPLGHLTARQARTLDEALDFLLMLRSRVQLNARRALDQLTFEIQEAIAPALYPAVRLPKGDPKGDGDSDGDNDIRPAVAPAVEALMQRFYLHARDVVRVSDRVLEMAQVPARRKPRMVRVDSVFLIFNGKLAVKDPNVFRERPAEMLRLFRVALEHDVPIYGHTKELIAELLASGEGEGARDVARDAARDVTRSLARDPVAARHFLDALVDPRDHGQPSLLEQMHQIGLLNAMMPEFAPCTCRVQHDLYHVYTVDQHQLYTVAMLKRLARGELAAEHPTATAILAEVPRREALYLGTLLHDVGKPLGKGHAEKGARLARAIAERLGMAAADVDTVEFLVRQHLTMAHLSQRRDLTDADVIARFAERVGSEQRLIQLYLCTLCDTAMTAPGNLSAWKEQLLEQLYRRSREFLRGGAEAEDSDAARQVAEARQRVIALMARPAPEASSEASGDAGEAADSRAPGLDIPDQHQIETFVTSVDERLFAALSPRQLARVVRLALQRQRAGALAELAVAHYPLKGHSELAVVADDVHGLLAALAGVLAANRIDVLGAVIGSRRSLAAHPAAASTGMRSAASPGNQQLALDVFFVRDLYGKAIPAEDSRWQRLRSDLDTVLRSERMDEAVTELLNRRRRPSTLGERVTPGVPTRIKIDNDASAEATVVEVFTRDRVGVLHAITRTLTAVGLDIHLSKVATEGEQVADIFYVTHGEPRRKLMDPDARAALEARLHQALDEV